MKSKTDIHTIPYAELIEQNKHLSEQIQALTELVKQRDVTIIRQQAQLTELLKRLYGRKSERLVPGQMLFDGLLLHAEAEGSAKPDESKDADIAEEKVREYTRTKHRGRVNLPEHLKRVEHNLDVEAEQKICNCCGKELKLIGKDITEKLDYQRASLFVNQYIRPKYACGNSECDCGITQAEVPAGPISRCEGESGLIAHIITEKFEHHNPLYRQEVRFNRQDVFLSRKTMSEWLAKSALLIKPLYELMRKKILSYDIVLNDDTPVAQQEPGLGKTRTARLWCTVGGENLQYRLYNYTRNRSREGPEEFFKNYKGYIVADAYSGYNGLFSREEIVHAACWAHARRYFIQAQQSSPREATEILTLIAKLYKIEKDYKQCEIGQRLQARQKKSKPSLEKIYAILVDLKARALPQSPLGKAINYSLGLWKPLNVYIEDERIPIDNNLAEQGIRPIALGRKNWLFVGNEHGGHTAAILMSFCATCRHLKIDTWAYLEYVLQNINDYTLSQLNELLPDNWKRMCSGNS